jgi:type II secretory pathway component GspD/PulD (secretin)
MRRFFLIGIFVFSGVMAQALSKEEWASVTLSRGLVPGQTVPMDKWNGVLEKLEKLPSPEPSATGRTPVDEAWASLSQKFGFEDKSAYSSTEWAAILAAIDSDQPLPQTETPSAPEISSSTSTAVSTETAPSGVPGVVVPVVTSGGETGAPPLEGSAGVPVVGPEVVAPMIVSPTEAAPSPYLEPSANVGPPTAGQRLTKKISLDLREMDVVEVLKILSRQSGMNIVVGRNVIGRVTVFLTDVDFWDALQTILETRDLAYVENGGLITVMTAQDYERVYGKTFGSKTVMRVLSFTNIDATRAKVLLDPFRSKVGTIVINEGNNTLQVEDTPESLARMEAMVAGFDLPTETRVFTLNSGTVEDILPKVSPLVSTGYGNIQADKRSNSIVVSDNPNRLGVIARMIDSFDVRDRAVLIEAKIVQILLTDDYQWGINWQYVFDRVAGNSLHSPIKGTLSQNLLGLPLSDVIPDANGNVKAKGVTGNVKVTSLPHGANFSSVINFLDTMVKSNMLSSPRIMALNNRESKIHVGTNQPILTRSIVNAGSSTTSPIVAEDVKFQPVGVSLAVTPSIGSDGYLTMKITPEVSSVDAIITTENGSSIPIVRTSEAESNILVKDGVTVVIGGLIEDQRSKTDSYVPIVGKIPLLGMPFRNRSKSVNKTELVIFLTPHIMTGDVKSPEADVYLPPYKKLLEKKAKKRGFFYRMFHWGYRGP